MGRNVEQWRIEASGRPIHSHHREYWLGVKLHTADRAFRGMATVWFATSAGLSAVRDGAWRTFHASDGLPPAASTVSARIARAYFRIGTSYGLAFLKNGKIHAVQFAAFSDPISPC